MVRSICVAVAILLSGCSVTEPQYPEPLRDKVYTSIEIVDRLPTKCPQKALACVIHSGGIGAIYIKRDVYPLCITHEVLHLFSGSWHHQASSEHCYEE